MHHKDVYIGFKNPVFMTKSWGFKHYLSLQEEYLQTLFSLRLDHLCGMWWFDVRKISIR
jgi:hypothetical protein